MRRIGQVVVAAFYWLASAFSGLLYWNFNWCSMEVMMKRSSNKTKLSPKEQYKELKALHQPLDKSLFAFARLQQNRNRYGNILPNEPTRVRLNDPEFYFNANWVLGGKAIASQGPKDDEVHEFWQMVWHGEVDAIVMLANPFEKGKNKCSKYWKKKSSASHNPEVVAKRSSKKTLFEKDGVKIVERKIKMTRDGEEKIVTQYHLQNWPDFGIVSPDTLAELVKIVSAREGEGRLLAHCSAGVGRTGTFFAAYQAFQEQTDDVFRIAADLRDPNKGRVGMIQTPAQYKLAGNAISLLLQS